MKVRVEFDSRVAFRCGVALAAAALAVCVPLYASQVGTLIRFSPGQVIRSSDMNSNFTALEVAINDTDNKCGNVTTLTTTAKGDLVSAVNEVNGKIPTGTLTSVTTDTTLTGAGTAASPLSVNFTAGETTYDARYLDKVTGGTISGPVTVLAQTSFTPPASSNGIESIFATGGTATSTAVGTKGGVGLDAHGGDESSNAGAIGGDAIHATGGSGGSGGIPGFAGIFQGKVIMTADTGGFVLNLGEALTVLGFTPITGTGGIGIAVGGGQGPTSGGIGLDVKGGDGNGSSGAGGDGVLARGGNATGTTGGNGIVTTGGTSTSSAVGTKGGVGLDAHGGDESSNAGANGGDAIHATGGSGGSGGIPGFAGIFHGGVIMTADTGGFVLNLGEALTVLGFTPITGTGGIGIAVGGGQGPTSGGIGLEVKGGDCNGSSGAGGDGVFAQGGNATGSGKGGNGITATPGTGGTTFAGQFNGNVNITGSCAKASGTFKIDHPLDPENKFLYHSFVESPDMKNVYDGVVVLDAKGEATVELPSYFEALNKDFRYQLTSVGGFAPVYVAEKIHENRFKIAGGREGLEVSWQVTGIRQDAYANAHRVQAEVEKSPTEKGKLLHPIERGRPESDGIYWDSIRLARALASTWAAAPQRAVTRPVVASRPASTRSAPHD
jgi:hypothetical protein